MTIVSTIKYLLRIDYNPEEYWNNIGKNTEFFRKTSATEPEDYKQLDYIYKQLPKFKKFLEIGCGQGRIIKHFQKKAKKAEFTGIDISETLLETAKEEIKGVYFYQHQAKELLFPEKTFDMVFSYATLNYVLPKDIEETITELKRVSSKYIVLCERINPTKIRDENNYTFYYNPIGFFPEWETTKVLHLPAGSRGNKHWLFIFKRKEAKQK